MTDVPLSLSGPDVVNIIRDMLRRKEQAEKISQVYFHLISSMNGSMDPESREAAEKILTGVESNERNLSEEIRTWVAGLGPGWFTVTQCDRELHIVTKTDKNNRRQVIHRMCDKGVLIRDKSVAERYQALRRDETIMDLDNVSLDTVDVSLPLALSRKTKLFHNAIVTVAGVTGMGKTMFGLNFIRENMDAHDIYYLNSEMSAQEIRYKKLAFKMVPYSSWRFTPIEVQGTMSESIRTDKINVIDYLTAPTDKLYMIRDLINDIKKKLGKGLALILIQRKGENPWGEGGVFSAQASSLYISLSFGTCIVMKNRFREADEFRGLEKRTFDIKDGLIVPTSGWFAEGSKEEKKQKYKGIIDDPDFVHEDG